MPHDPMNSDVGDSGTDSSTDFDPSDYAPPSEDPDEFGQVDAGDSETDTDPAPDRNRRDEREQTYEDAFDDDSGGGSSDRDSGGSSDDTSGSGGSSGSNGSSGSSNPGDDSGGPDPSSGRGPTAEERAETIKEGGSATDDTTDAPADDGSPSFDPRPDTYRVDGSVDGGGVGDGEEADAGPGADGGGAEPGSTRGPTAEERAEVRRTAAMEQNIDEAKGGEVTGREIGGDTAITPQQEAAVEDLEEETVIDLGPDDVDQERVQQDGETVFRYTLTDEALDREQRARREQASEINTASDRDYAGVNRREVDAFTGGSGVSAADEVLAERQREQRTADIETQVEDDLETQLEDQTGADLEAGEDFTVQETDQGYRAELTDEGQREVRYASERFGDIPIQNPNTGNRVETDLRRADRWWQENVAETAGQVAGEAFSPHGGESSVQRFVGGGAQGAAGVVSPAGIALEAKEVGEFAATQPQRVIETGEGQEGQLRTGQNSETASSPNPATNIGASIATDAPVSVDEQGAESFGRDVERTLEDTAQGATEAFEEDPAGSAGRAVGGLATAGYLGSRAARSIPGVSGSDLSGQIAIGTARTARRGASRVKSAGRRFVESDRAQGQIPRGRQRGDSGDSGLPDELSAELSRFETQTAIRRGKERAEQDFIEEQQEAARRQERPGEPYTPESDRDAYTPPEQDDVYTASDDVEPARGATERQRQAYRSSFDDDVDLSPRESQLAAQMDTPTTDMRRAVRSGELIDETGAVRQSQRTLPGESTGSLLRFGAGTGLGSAVGAGALSRSDQETGIGPMAASDAGARADVRSPIDTRADSAIRSSSDARTDSDLRSAMRVDFRNDMRADTRQDFRTDTRVDTRQDIRQDTRTDLNLDSRADARSDPELGGRDTDRDRRRGDLDGWADRLDRDLINPFTGE